ncbi:prolyl oligopeptidase family serine peptidase [Pseudoalteromonas sp. MMG010]|uniref:S9 family peptidase n=1 Tax=Pseudoalteromonas sp. MMG010 TaxID=2822685 RepID=UPI001B3A60B8|nr:prolyl oligopeptidase family serine peptidase [Pseudoalteromonas sp. MMG010]MBQ4832436.1 prolyl oligopeptidase family serine peptidase [Pseudoalteromonas sp. MMG010]
MSFHITAKKSLLAIGISTSLFLTGCASSSSAEQPNQVSNISPEVILSAEVGSEKISLKQAMAHPDWISRKAESAYFLADSSSIIYRQKQAGNELRDTFIQNINSTEAKKIAVADLHTVGAKNSVYSNNKQLQAYTFQGNVFVKNIAENKITQITRSTAKAFKPQFLNDGNLVYRTGSTIVYVDLNTGLSRDLVSLKLADKPKGIQAPSTYIAKEQHKLIDYIALQHKNKLDRQAQQKQLKEKNQTINSSVFYLGANKSIDEMVLSPSGDSLIVVIKDKSSWRSDTDIMPHYVTDDATIKPVKVRRRIADAKSSGSQFIYIDLTTNEQQTLKLDTLPGFDEDVLASVKEQNYKREGKKYTSKKAPRDINLVMDWSSSQPLIKYNSDGSQVALMLEAWDNKDRWLATVDVKNNKLVSQHRLHDDAWIAYSFNEFGWLNNSDTLYYLSEETGYSQLYKKSLNGKAVALTSGMYEVSSLTLSDNNEIYYKANVEHPGLYEIYKVDLQTKKSVQITNLDGMTDYNLSPDGKKLLLTHSKISRPEELYVKDLADINVPAKQLTHTVSEQFLATKLTIPKIIAVPSSHTEQPIYAKVYYPADYKEGETGKNRKAVIFNHGAGYLQNSHMGWSVYFREFMFHSLLADEGYIVMDMDYRASKGYGRDWRTAIYRQMGTPETQDLVDGVKWLSDNANVDTDAVGTYGGSYGGFMTFMALFTAPDLFQSGAALRPVSDWAHYNTGYTANILNTPDVDPIAYERSSPIYFAEGLTKPLLINAPMVDDNVFFQDSVRLVQRLIELEKTDFETAIFPVEPHGFKQPSSWLDEYRRIYKLFKETL